MNIYLEESGLFAACRRAKILPKAGCCVKQFGEFREIMRFDANHESDGGSLTDWRW
jgi:hypothetical protein